MDSHKFSPDERSIVKYMNDEDLSYIMIRYRQTHDFWHVLTGWPTSVLGTNYVTGIIAITNLCNNSFIGILYDLFRCIISFYELFISYYFFLFLYFYTILYFSHENNNNKNKES